MYGGHQRLPTLFVWLKKLFSHQICRADHLRFALFIHVKHTTKTKKSQSNYALPTVRPLLIVLVLLALEISLVECLCHVLYIFFGAHIEHTEPCDEVEVLDAGDNSWTIDVPFLSHAQFVDCLEEAYARLSSAKDAAGREYDNRTGIACRSDFLEQSIRIVVIVRVVDHLSTPVKASHTINEGTPALTVPRIRKERIVYLVLVIPDRFIQEFSPLLADESK